MPTFVIVRERQQVPGVRRETSTQLGAREVATGSESA